jgi:Secretion system C-terminal sorting domain
VYVLGSFNDTINFNTPTAAGSNQLVAVGNNIFIAQYNTGGALQWARRTGCGGNCETGKIAAEAGAVYFATNFATDIDFNTPANPAWASVQYGLYYAAGQVYVYLSGQGQGYYGNVQPGDRLSILRTGGAVNFYRNNKSFLGTAAPANTTLVADLAMFSSGARVQGLQGHNLCTAPAAPLAARTEGAPAPTYEAPGLAVYPNPTAGRFTVALANLGQAELQVLDVLGRQVLRQPADGPLTNLNLSDHPAGHYLVRVRGEGFSHTLRITKQ